MKRFIPYILFLILGFSLSFLWFKSRVNQYQTEQVNIIKNGIKNVSKLVVVEETYSEYYNYNDAKLYFFNSKFFEKQVVLFVKAKVLVSYDLTKMKTELDSVNKKIIVKTLPKQELNVIPTYKYYDFDQSMFNSFTKEELNKFQNKSIKHLVEDLDVSNSKSIAKRRLFEELERFFSVAKLLGWTVEDQTDKQTLEHLIKLPQ